MLNLQSNLLEKVVTEKIDDINKTKKIELDSSNNKIDRVGEVTNNAVNQTTNSMMSVKESNNKTIDTFKDMIGFMNEDKKNTLENSKEQHEKLIKVDEARHKSEIEAVYYRTKEETLNEISKNISTYAESVKYINEKIKNLRLEIQFQEKKIEFDKKVFEELTHNLKIEESKYQDLNSDFNTLIDSIEKLANEYKDSMEEKEYVKNIKREKRALEKYMDKIENIELRLLNKEKERLIIEKKLKPKLDEIENLKLSLKYLQNERDGNEFMGLLNLSNIQTKNLLVNGEERNEIINVDIEDDRKLLEV